MRFVCKRCLQCCITLTEHGKFSIPLTKEDAQILRKNLKFQEMKKANKISIKKGSDDPLYPYDLIAHGLCPFLDRTVKECIIYPDRPSNCKKFTCSLQD
jgi:Fe-S-cluster containining protein